MGRYAGAQARSLCGSLQFPGPTVVSLLEPVSVLQTVEGVDVTQTGCFRSQLSCFPAVGILDDVQIRGYPFRPCIQRRRWLAVRSSSGRGASSVPARGRCSVTDSSDPVLGVPALPSAHKHSCAQEAVGAHGGHPAPARTASLASTCSLRPSSKVHR